MPKSNDFFKGKRILVGDYIKISADYTTKNLNKLGIIVDVVQKGEDIVKIIKSGEKNMTRFLLIIYIKKDTMA